MTKRRVLLYALAAVFCTSWCAPARAQRTAAPAGQKAGEITALLPVTKIVRGKGRAVSTSDAARGSDVFWEDLVKTQKGGRARIRLLDQSLLSVGSQAELRIVRHDARSRQTALELGYGRVRSQVAALTRGGRYEVRTPTAVAGVIGTDFGTTSTIGSTDFLCISGTVDVSNSDPNVPGTVQCTPGTVVTVTTGNPPSPPRPATQQEILELIQDTEPAVITGLVPNAVLVGSTVQATATGAQLAGVTGAGIDGQGVQVTLGEVTETSAALNLEVAEDAPAGPRVITLTKAGGAGSAAVLAVLITPDAGDVGDPVALRQAFLDIFEQERQAAIAGINGLGMGVQQSADQGAQQLEEANAGLLEPINLAPAGAELNGEVQGVQQAMIGTGTAINQSASQASTDFGTAFDAALAQLQAGQIEGPGFSGAVQQAFTRINGAMLQAFQEAFGNLGEQALQRNSNVLAIAERWLGQIREAVVAQGVLPTPRVGELTVQLGEVAEFDGSQSSAAAGASIQAYQWALCGPAYRPSNFGVPLPGNDTSCPALAGFASTASDFAVQTCTLEGGDYAVRLRVTDSNNLSAAMDGRLSVLPPTYDPPVQRLQDLASAYMALLPEQFLNFFDPVEFSGFTALQENIRNTINVLNSMSINLRISQVQVNCNEANLRAEWEQNYTFKTNITQVFSQSAQLTVRMTRVPGRGWFITQMQGDNGTLQGVPPGPIVIDAALPDLQVTQLIVNGQSGGSPLSVRPGNNTFTAVVTNVGGADLAQNTSVTYSLRDALNVEIASATVNVPAPLAVGASAQFTAVLAVPNLAAGTAASMVATVNPSCAVPETACDPLNSFNQALQVGALGPPDLAVTLAPGDVPLPGDPPAISGEPFDITAVVTNNGPGDSAGGERVTVYLNGAVAGHAFVPGPLLPGQTVNVPLHGVVPDPIATGTSLGVLEVGVSSLGDANLSNNQFSVDVPTSDWSLVITGSGTQASPISICAGECVGDTTVEVQQAAQSPFGDVVFDLRQGLVSNNISLVLERSSLSGATSLSSGASVTAALSAVDGQYFAQVVAEIEDGGAVTARRQATIQIAVGTGEPQDTITVTTNPDAVQSRVQLNGPLAQTVELSADGGNLSGTVDLHFSPAPELAVTPEGFQAVAYNATIAAAVAAAVQPNGQISAVDADVIVSATAVSPTPLAIAALAAPDPVGTEQTTLMFRIGDIEVSGPTCINLAPGATASLSLTFFPINGFNATLNWQWVSLASGVTVNNSSGTSAPNGSLSFTFTNTNTVELGGHEAVLAVTISNQNGSATKSFPFFFSLTSTPGCQIEVPALRIDGGRGSWGAVSLSSTGPAILSAPSIGKLPDLRVEESSISFSPSIPRAGDTLQVRFRLTNAGAGDAVSVPVALQVDGRTVASDTYDLAAGRTTLAVLEWQVDTAPLRVMRTSPQDRYTKLGMEGRIAPLRLGSVSLAVDPARTIRQQSTTGKTVALRQLSFGTAPAGSDPALSGGGTMQNRTLIEVGDASCLGFRFSSGAGGTCESADLEIMVEDLTDGKYTLASPSGIADLGLVSFTGVDGSVQPSYTSQLAALAGHTYAVQLSGGRMGLLTVRIIRNPQQLSAKSRRTFGRGAGSRTLSKLGDDPSGPAAAGDVSGAGRDARVYFEVVYHVQ